jgi:hypothetical protein
LSVDGLGGPHAREPADIVGLGVGALGVALVTASVFAAIAPTNFGGYDEWLILSLVHRGLASIPFAGRPLELVFDLPAARLAPHNLSAFLLLHGTYQALSGFLVFLLVRRLSPGTPQLGLVAGLLTAVWAPLDFLRLNAVETLAYSGTTLAALVASVLFVFAWTGRSQALLAGALLVGIVAGRSYESALGLLAGAPLLVPGRLREKPRAFWAWVACWEGVLVLHLAYVGWLLAAGTSGAASPSYQAQALGLDLHPVRVLGRLAVQVGHQLRPLAAPPWGDLLAPQAVAALLAAAGAFLLHARLTGATWAEASRVQLGLLGRGAALTALGYSFFLVTASLRSAARTQFLSAPGIGLLLAVAITWLASRVFRRWRTAAAAALVGGSCALAAAGTIGMQREWDAASYWPAQSRCLAALVRLAPRVEPGTVFVLLDETGTWPANFSFRHAVAYLYEGRALGYAAGAHPLLYDARFEPGGLRYEPWDVIRGPWQERPSLHPHASLVVLRQREEGRLELLEEWPGEILGALPGNAEYRPRTRVLPGAPPLPARILGPAQGP